MRQLSAGRRSPIDLRQYCWIDIVSDVLQDAIAQNMSRSLQVEAAEYQRLQS